MGVKTISIYQTFNAPVEQVFSTLSDHARFGEICGAKAVRVKDGEDGANGLGSVRQLNIGPLPSFDETITKFVSNEFIEYKISRGSPIKNHVGTMRFAKQGDKCVLDYTIELESKIPLTTGLIKLALENAISGGLKKYAGTLI